MKKITLCLMLILALIIVPGAIFAAEGDVAKIGNTGYATLADAVADVPTNGTETTITLLKNVEKGPGIVTVKGQNVVIDFDGFTYDASKPTVGSDGTETNSCQLRKDSTVTFKNGTFTSTEALRIIQNYANLTLENMIIDGTKSSNKIDYVASFNNGKVNIIGNTSILATEGNYAFDNYFWPENGNDYSKGSQITINTTGTIKGNIEFASSKAGLKTALPSTLTIKNIKHEGTFNFVDERFKENVEIEKGIFISDVSAYIIDGVVCKKINDVYCVGAEHTITVKEAEGGKVIVREVPTSNTVKEIDKAISGETVEVVVEPAEGYKFKGISGVDGLKDVAEYAYQFVMPNKDVVLTPVFEKMTTEAEVPSEVANEKEVEEMLIETLKENKELAEIIKDKNVEIKVEVKEKEVTSSEKEKIESAASKEVADIKVTNYIDITIYVKDADNGKNLGNLETVKEAITFTVPVPEDLPELAEGFTRIFYIVREHDGDIDVWEVKEADGKLSFESDKFSTYAIAYKDVKDEVKNDVTTGEGETEQQPEVKPEVKPEEKPETDNKKEEIPESVETGDNIVVYAVFAVVAMAGMLITIKMRRK